MPNTKRPSRAKAAVAPDTSKSALVEVQPIRPTKDSHPISEALKSALSGLNGIRRTFYEVLPKTAQWLHSEHEKNAKRLAKFRQRDADDEAELVLTSAHEVAEVLETIRELKGLGGRQILTTLERSLFTQVFSEFDSFIGALLTAIYTKKTDLLKGISRELSLSELLEFDSLEAVKINMLEKEVETFRRESYVDQFATLERKFGFKTLRDFKEWGEFVELAQRRNLLVHNGGRVSEQYLVVCEREGHAFERKPAIGDQLNADAAYFARAIIVVSKVAFMLTHTLWRKVFPAELEQANQEANQTIYDLLEQKRWKTAAEISAFALSEQMRKGLSEIHMRLRIINAAIGLKFSKSEEAAGRLIDTVDWSASYRDFRLATAVLKDDFQQARDLMVAIGKAGELVNEVAYHRWPLFHKFRETSEFQTAYEEIYGVSFVKKIVRDAVVDGIAEEPLKPSRPRKPARPRAAKSETGKKRVRKTVQRKPSAAGRAPKRS